MVENGSADTKAQLDDEGLGATGGSEVGWGGGGRREAERNV